MDVRPGYKWTDVGVIPEEWEVRPLGTILHKGRLGGNYPNQDRETDYPLMKMGNLARGYIDITKVEYIVPGVKPDPVHKLSHGDVLNTRNTLDLVGKVAMWRDELPVAYYNSNLMRLEFDPLQVASNEYASSALNTAGSIANLRALATGTTSVAAIYTRDLMRMPFVVPRTEEQRAIATALSDVNALLDALDRLIVKKHYIKRAAMQRLLTGQTRLPGFHGEWKVKRLGDMLTICHGRNQHEVEMLDGPYPILATGGQIGTANRYLYDKPSVLIGRKGTINQPQYMDTPFWTVDTLFYSVLREGNSAKFMFYRFWLIDWQLYNEASGVPSLNAGTIENIELKAPEPNEQAAIAEVLTDMDEELTALEKRREKTRALMQGLMQELLSGKTRLVSQEVSHV